MKLFVLLFASVLSGFFLMPDKISEGKFSEKSSLTEVLLRLGDKKPLHYTNEKDSVLIQQGYEIITKGRTVNPQGKKSSLQSKYFTCVDCHNVMIEDPDLRKSDPDARLKYAAKNNIPFLSATTFYGMVNREHWYNQDYQKKYGDLVKPAKDTLVNAIHLCTVECSQGRPFEKWELDAVMAYLYSIEYKLEDLKLTEVDYKKLNSFRKGEKNEELIKWIKTFYLQYSPATFLDPIKKENREYGKNGNPENGKLVYEISCMQCHATGRVTNYTLDQNSIDLKHLKNNLKTKSYFSLYDITRKGTYSLPGYRPYMPNYTLERLSHQQLEDLAAYINTF